MAVPVEPPCLTGMKAEVEKKRTEIKARERELSDRQQPQAFSLGLPVRPRRLGRA